MWHAWLLEVELLSRWIYRENKYYLAFIFFPVDGLITCLAKLLKISLFWEVFSSEVLLKKVLLVKISLCLTNRFRNTFEQQLEFGKTCLEVFFLKVLFEKSDFGEKLHCFLAYGLVKNNLCYFSRSTYFFPKSLAKHLTFFSI